MNTTISRRNLLSAARAFIRGSAGAAAVAIVPLAAVSLVNTAKAGGPAIFSTNVNNSGGGGGNTNFAQGTFSASALTQMNNIIGVRQLDDGTFTTTSPFTSGGAALYFGSGAVTNDGVNNGQVIPVAYNFSLIPTGGISAVSWTLFLDTSDGGFLPVASGTGTGNFIGQGSYTFDSSSLTFYEPQLNISYNSLNVGDTMEVSMNPNFAAVSINGLPEPGTTAVLTGLGALGLVFIRRLRRVVA